ncbi:hypothetical protein BS78_03G068500 [Paspalum vaginatum]|nr:hypothetical protein BS78_03G068500 [Paspalum vaginatum]
MLPVERYKLDAITEDETGTMIVMIFDDPAKQLVGVAAEDLAEEDIDDVISAVISSQQRHAFVVDFGNGCFVSHILNDDELQLLKSGSDHREAGGLSQDEGSSASCISNSQVEQEEMVIKEEVEAVGDGGLSQEGSSASYISNSRVKQEETVIKEEMEAGGGGELSQEEGSSASYSSSPVKKLKR